MRTTDLLLSEIDAFLKASGMTASAFGKAALNDPNFVGDLTKGREPKSRIVERVRSFIEQNEGAAA